MKRQFFCDLCKDSMLCEKRIACYFEWEDDGNLEFFEFDLTKLCPIAKQKKEEEERNEQSRLNLYREC